RRVDMVELEIDRRADLGDQRLHQHVAVLFDEIRELVKDGFAELRVPPVAAVECRPRAGHGLVHLSKRRALELRHQLFGGWIHDAERFAFAGPVSVVDEQLGVHHALRHTGNLFIHLRNSFSYIAHGYSPVYWVAVASWYCSSLTFSIQSAVLPSRFSTMEMWVMAVVGVAPCQCFSPGGNQITSPGRISLIGPPQRCTRPQPAVTIRVCPSGCVCHAVRAPGSKVTLAPTTRAGSGASNSISARTVPVNQSAGPFAEGCVPILLISIVCFSSNDRNKTRRAQSRIRGDSILGY